MADAPHDPSFEDLPVSTVTAGRESLATGGVIRGPGDASDDQVSALLSPGFILSAGEAEALGLTADARRMRDQSQ